MQKLVALFISVLSCLAYVTSNAKELASIEFISGSFTQGGLVIGKTAPENKIYLNQKPVKVGADGIVLLGFDRDAELSQTIKVVGKSANEMLTLTLIKQDYPIERIDGLPSSKVTPQKPEVLKRIRQEVALVKKAREVQSERRDFLQQIQWPATGRISGVYGSQRILNGVPKRPHFGLDIANKTGSPVVAPWSGKVVLVHQDMFYTGGTLIIDHGMGVTTTYIHLDKLHVEQGQQVAQGDLIGEIGMTGRATGPHLDWRLNLGQQRLDPYLLVKHIEQGDATQN